MSDRKPGDGGEILTIVKIPESPTWWFYGKKNKQKKTQVSCDSHHFCRNARGLIVWENNLGKWNIEREGEGERERRGKADFML